MRTICLLLLCLGAGSFAFGQLQSDTVTIQSARTINLQPDQVVFSVSVTSSVGATLDQVVALLAGTGITAADLSGVFAPSAPLLPAPAVGPGLLWSFTLGVPWAKMKATIASLTALQASLQKNNAILSFQIQGSRISPELAQAQTCSVDDLVADARVQAQKVAQAAGLSAGPIVAVSGGSSGGVSNLVQNIATPAVFTFQSGFQIGGSISFLTSPITAPVNCSAQVKFKLNRYQVN